MKIGYFLVMCWFRARTRSSGYCWWKRYWYWWIGRQRSSGSNS